MPNSVLSNVPWEISPMCCLQSYLTLLQRLVSCIAIWQCHCAQQPATWIHYISAPVKSVSCTGYRRWKRTCQAFRKVVLCMPEHSISSVSRRKLDVGTFYHLLPFSCYKQWQLQVWQLCSPVFSPLLLACVCHTNFVTNCGHETKQFLTLPP